GSPAMNFFDANIVGTRDEVALDTGSFKLPVPGDRRAKLASYFGKTLVLGVRPEDIHDRALAPAAINGAPISTTVDVLEPMGSEIFLYLLAGKQNFIARVDPRSQARPGQSIEVMLNLDRMHLFDKQSEQAIF
ncbi:MAG: TOBE domain-containing protein, partial [Chloroflexi bacterium]|nr:TOBE domain-containing protein [Chloroflexota bacterium]